MITADPGPHSAYLYLTAPALLLCGLYALLPWFSLMWQPWLKSRKATAQVHNAIAFEKTTTSPFHRLSTQSEDFLWAKKPESATHVIEIYSGKRFQEILGFGGAFTDASCFLFSQLSPEARAKLFFELFHPSQLGLSVCRTCIGASNYATHLYSYDNDPNQPDGIYVMDRANREVIFSYKPENPEPDPELQRFSIAHDKRWILPMLKEAQQVNPDLFLFSSPWSPPGWMKSNRSMLGGCMQRSYMSSYARYFLKFLRAYEEEGVPIQAVTVQNEVDTDQDGRMPACVWPQEYEVSFVVDHLGPLFKREQMDTQIWMIDHNYNLWGRAVASLEDPQVRKHVSAIAWHGYAGDPSRMIEVRANFPDVFMHWTEGGPDILDHNYANDWTRWSHTFTGILQNSCRAITTWNLALDENGRPNIGPFTCGGLVTINNRTKEVYKSGQYWALAHYSKFVRRGARRVASCASFWGANSDAAQKVREQISHVAFKNPDGTVVLVVTNGGPEQVISIKLAGWYSQSIRLEQDSITTLVWSPPSEVQ